MIRNEIRLAVAGTMLIGVTYGLARFAFGLYLPGIRDDVGLSSAMAGIIGSSAYAGYCVSILASALLVERFGARCVAVAAALVAAAGMTMIAASMQPIWLLAGVLLAGASTGLASPPMAEAVARWVPASRQGRVNTVINAGTSVGVAVSGPVAFLATGQWRIAYAAFAVAAIFNAVLLFCSLPRASREVDAREDQDQTNANGRGKLCRPLALRLALVTVGMGFASAAYWTFSSEALVNLGHFNQSMANIVWILIGVAGLAGAVAGDLISRLGIDGVNRGSLAALALSLVLLALLPTSLPAVLISAVLFGAAYIMLTGVYLVWGIRLYWDRPGVGIGLPFLMIAVGQVIGSPLAGYLIGSQGYALCFTVFALVALFTGVVGYRDASQAAEERQHRDSDALHEARQRQVAALENLYMPAMPPLDLLAWAGNVIRRVVGRRRQPR
ncbi:MFS transporter [Salinicola rhizosphaerae]|uniref:MFS transporter n=1 Tax=Salinicola rhizosphaerae TaxID=1443141 RepID=A0ABQ3E193_9GAMM|nr:MFS transporter [Salinicola rhizosphaerae]GHB17833.1 MFS transporter [Salinicola rhizosphaerae]